MNNHQKGLALDNFLFNNKLNGCPLLQARNKKAISPEQNTVPDEIKQLVSSGVDWQVLLQKWVVAEISVDVRHVGRFLCLIDIVQQRSDAGLEERRLAAPAPSTSTTFLGTHPGLQIQILLRKESQIPESH